MVPAKVVGWSKNADDEVQGSYHMNSMLNTIDYDVQFLDGAIHEYHENTISQNVYSQVDADGFSHDILDGILDFHISDDAIPLSKKYFVTL